MREAADPTARASARRSPPLTSTATAAWSKRAPAKAETPTASTAGSSESAATKGETRSVKFDKTGCSPVMLCNVHPEMEGFVVVLQNPYAGVTDKSGLYSIPNVPEGKYKLKVWNRKFLEVAFDVVVPKAGDAKCDVVLK